MEQFMWCFISGLFISFFMVFFWNSLLKNDINYKQPKIYISVVVISLSAVLVQFVLPQYLKLTSDILIFMIVNYIFYCRNITKNLLIVIYSDIVMFAGEAIFVLLISFAFKDSIDVLYNLSFGSLIINIAVTIICFILIKFKFIYKIFDYLCETFSNMKSGKLIIYTILTVMLMGVFLIMTYMNLSYVFVATGGAILTIFYLIMLFGLANAKENYRKISNKYETSLSSLREYEKIMNCYRIDNHENKNQLLTIRNMVKQNDKKVANYIDKLINNKIKDNEAIFYKTSKIPEGGLRAIIYSKVCKMEELKINYELDIATDVSTANLINIGDYTILNICKIIGVFLDNAIEAVEELKKKQVIIEIFIMEGKLYIDISNNYKYTIELDKLSSEGYTTKGKGHGYGLSLVDSIIKYDENICHEIKISKEVFTQRLKIKM